MNGYALMGSAYALVFRCGMNLVAQGRLFEGRLPGLLSRADGALLMSGTWVAALWLVMPKLGPPLVKVLLVASAMLVLRGLPTEARTMAFDILRGKRAV